MSASNQVYGADCLFQLVKKFPACMDFEALLSCSQNSHISFYPEVGEPSLNYLAHSNKIFPSTLLSQVVSSFRGFRLEFCTHFYYFHECYMPNTSRPRFNDLNKL